MHFIKLLLQILLPCVQSVFCVALNTCFYLLLILSTSYSAYYAKSKMKKASNKLSSSGHNTNSSDYCMGQHRRTSQLKGAFEQYVTHMNSVYSINLSSSTFKVFVQNLNHRHAFGFKTTHTHIRNMSTLSIAIFQWMGAICGRQAKKRHRFHQMEPKLI